MAVLHALGSLRKRDPNQLNPLPAEAKASIAIWVGQEEVPQDLEERLMEVLSQISKEEADLIAKSPTERKALIQNLRELVEQLDADLVVKLGEHKWPHEQTKGWVIRHLRGRFPNLALRSQSEMAKAIFLGLQAFRFKNSNATEDLMQRVDLADIAPCIPWIAVAPPGLQLNIRRASVIGNDLKSMSKRPYPTHNPFFPTMKSPPHQEPTINPHTLPRSAQKHMIPLHDYITRNTATPVSQALHPTPIARKIHCPTTLKIHAITPTISSYKLLSETILIGLTETSVSITTPSYIAKNIERNTKHTRKHKPSRTQLTASTRTSKQITKVSPTISQTEMIPLHVYPNRCTETPVSHNSLKELTTRLTLTNTAHTHTVILHTHSFSCTIEPHGVTQLI
jgi:hypothetical protein